jgi:TolB-like protein/class 3 adenylate cyclase
MATPGHDRLERRLGAILAADVAGYSRLTGEDEEGTHARLQGHVRSLVDPKIAEYRGRVVKNTGDGLLAEFSSVVDAVRCAVDVQRGMAERNADVPEAGRIEFRIGINVGDVILDRGDIFGDGVNIAARLEGVAEPGGVCISWDAYRQVKGKVDIAVADLGEQQLKNIAEPVRVFAIQPEKHRTLAIPFPASHRNVTRPPRLSLVVLPFSNLSKSNEQDYLVDSITENLSIELSRIRGAFVVASRTAFTYKEKRSDVRQIGRELGVRYAIEGSVQPGADRLRVNAQLIDAETGAYLWAERYDKPSADLFAMQDEITNRLARALGVELVAAESRRISGKRPEDLDAIDLSMRGHAIRNQSYSRERASQARELFEAALRLDDQNVDALIQLSIVDSTEVITKPATRIACEFDA